MAEKHKCPVCKKYVFDEYNSLEICEVCGWQDDAVQQHNPDSRDGANSISFNEAVMAYKER